MDPVRRQQRRRSLGRHVPGRQQRPPGRPESGRGQWRRSAARQRPRTGGRYGVVHAAVGPLAGEFEHRSGELLLPAVQPGHRQADRCTEDRHPVGRPDAVARSRRHELHDCRHLLSGVDRAALQHAALPVRPVLLGRRRHLALRVDRPRRCRGGEHHRARELAICRRRGRRVLAERQPRAVQLAGADHRRPRQARHHRLRRREFPDLRHDERDERRPRFLRNVSGCAARGRCRRPGQVGPSELDCR